MRETTGCMVGAWMFGGVRESEPYKELYRSLPSLSTNTECQKNVLVVEHNTLSEVKVSYSS